MKKIITLKGLFTQADDLEKMANGKNISMIFNVNDSGIEIWFYDKTSQADIYRKEYEWGRKEYEWGMLVSKSIATRIDKINAVFKDAEAFIKNYTKKNAIEEELATLEKRSAELRKKLQEEVL